MNKARHATRREFVAALGAFGAIRAGAPIALADAAIALPASAQAQAAPWPSRPVSWIVGFPPGGNIDAVARVLAPVVGEQLGQPVVVDNRPGASGTIAAGQLARAAPDGHSMILLSLGHATSATLYSKLPYQPVDDFKAVGLLVNNPFVIIAAAGAPYRSVADVVATARQKPRQIDFGTAGIGTGMHLVAELFESRAGIALNHIPYKSGPALQVALLANEVPLVFSTPAVTVPLQGENKIRVLAVTSRERYPALPDVPTLVEAGYPDMEVSDFLLLAAPKGTPDAVAARMNAAIAHALARPDVRAQLVRLGTVPAAPITPAAAQQLLAREVDRWRKVIADAGLAGSQ